ncbi:MAG TPA: DJ-1/PfpI family protein [Planctomycetota bacterium]
MKLLVCLVTTCLAPVLVRLHQEAPAAEFVCPPCGEECHFTTYPAAGGCGVCGMALVPLSSVPQVGVLVLPQTTLASSMTTLAVFSAANVGRVFTVADTAQPLRLSDALEIRPQFALAQAPALDVLVVTDGYGIWDDELVVEWVRAAAARARAVVAVGRGALVLARAGLLAGERVPADAVLARRGSELVEGVHFDVDLAYRRSGKLFLARDPGSALDACLAAIAELGGPERARGAATALGHAWTPGVEER